MYNYSEHKHQLSINSIAPSAPASSFLTAPPILIIPESFHFRAEYSKPNGYSSLRAAHSITTASPEVSTKSGKLPNQCQSLPSVHVLTNCALQREIIKLPTKFEDYKDLWRLCSITTNPKGCDLRFIHIPSAQTGIRFFTTLHLKCAFLKFQCRIQYAKGNHRCEIYKCRFEPHDTSENHAPVEIGIRSFSNRPNTSSAKDRFNCCYTISDYLK